MRPGGDSLTPATSPADITYTYNRTLQSSEIMLVISVDTEYGCQFQDPVDPAQELTDDALWLPWWQESAGTARPKARKRWSTRYKDCRLAVSGSNVEAFDATGGLQGPCGEGHRLVGD